MPSLNKVETSTDSSDQHNIVEFFIPEGISGIVYLNFTNLDGNEFAKTSIPIVINRIENTMHIPNWIKNNALWWSENQIDDETFIRGNRVSHTESNNYSLCHIRRRKIVIYSFLD